MTAKQNLIVIGNGMVGHKFLELMVSSNAAKTGIELLFVKNRALLTIASTSADFSLAKQRETYL